MPSRDRGLATFAGPGGSLLTIGAPTPMAPVERRDGIPWADLVPRGRTAAPRFQMRRRSRDRARSPVAPSGGGGGTSQWVPGNPVPAWPDQTALAAWKRPEVCAPCEETEGE